MSSEFCRSMIVDEVQMAFLVDLVGATKWGITLVYPGDNGKLMFHQLEQLFETANAALVEIELNSDGLLSTLI